MQFRYGSYLSSMSEAGLSIEREGITGATGFLVGIRERWTIEGFLQASDSNALTGLCTQLELAFTANFQLAELIGNDGSVLRFMLPFTPFGGTRVISPPSYPRSGLTDAEYSTYRTYKVVIEGVAALPAILAQGANPTLFFHETISKRGTGGQRFVYRQPLTGLPQQQTVAEYTPIHIVQRGNAIGLTSYPFFGDPFDFLAVLPRPFEHQEMEEIEKGNPDRAGALFYNYPLSWTFVFEGTSFDTIESPLFQGT